MTDETLVHQAEFEFQGDIYEVVVFCRSDGRHFAKTYFGEDDVIINDGSSLEEALARHERLLPLAVSSRKILQEYSGSPRRRFSRA